MSVSEVETPGARPVDYVIAWVVGLVLAASTYLLGLIVAFIVIFWVMEDQLAANLSDIAIATVLLFSLAAFATGLVGAWGAARGVVRKDGHTAGVWGLVTGIAAVGVVLLVLSLGGTNVWSTLAQVAAFVVGVIGGTVLALRGGRAGGPQTPTPPA